MQSRNIVCRPGWYPGSINSKRTIPDLIVLIPGLLVTGSIVILAQNIDTMQYRVMTSSIDHMLRTARKCIVLMVQLILWLVACPVMGLSQIQILEGSLNFDSVSIGTQKQRSFTLMNQSQMSQTISFISSNPQFKLGSTSLTLTSMAQRSVAVDFIPQSYGFSSGTILVNGAAGISVSGIGKDPLSISPSSWAYGSVNVGAYYEKSFLIKNLSSTSLGLNIIGGTSEFIPNATQIYISANSSTYLTIRFSPGSNGYKSATVSFKTQANLVVGQIQLNGSGMGTIDLSIEQLSISPTNVAPGMIVNVMSLVRNNGNQSTPSFAVRWALSPTPSYGAGTIPLASSQWSSIGSNQLRQAYQSIVIPSGLSSSLHYLVFWADYLNQVTESNEQNNIAWVPITVIQTSPDMFESNETYSAASSIGIGTNYLLSLHSKEDIDWLRFQGVKGRTYTITLSPNENPSLDTYLEVYRNTFIGTPPLIASDDDGGYGMFSRVVVTADQTSPMLLKIKNLTAITGGYLVRVDETIVPTADVALSDLNMPTINVRREDSLQLNYSLRISSIAVKETISTRGYLSRDNGISADDVELFRRDERDSMDVRYFQYRLPLPPAVTAWNDTTLWLIVRASIKGVSEPDTTNNSRASRFTLLPKATQQTRITRTLYDDWNINGVKDPEEPVLFGRPLKVYVNGTASSISDTTDEHGMIDRTFNLNGDGQLLTVSVIKEDDEISQEMVDSVDRGTVDTTMVPIFSTVRTLFPSGPVTPWNGSEQWHRGTPNPSVRAIIGQNAGMVTIDSVASARTLSIGAFSTLHFTSDSALLQVDSLVQNGTILVDSNAAPLLRIRNGWVVNGAVVPGRSSIEYGGRSITFGPQLPVLNELTLLEKTEIKGSFAVKHHLSLGDTIALGESDTAVVLSDDANAIEYGKGKILNGSIRRRISTTTNRTYPFESPNTYVQFNAGDSLPTFVTMTVHAARRPDSLGGAWEMLEQCVVDTADHTITAFNVKRFSRWIIRIPKKYAIPNDRSTVADSTVDRIYEITSSGGKDWSATLCLRFDPSELPEGIDERELRLYRQQIVTPDEVQSTEQRIVPGSLIVEQNFPNPFNSSTKFTVTVPVAGHLRVTVYNLLGQRVTTLHDRSVAPGRFELQWEAVSNASGIYFYRCELVPDRSGPGPMMTVNRMLYLR